MIDVTTYPQKPHRKELKHHVWTFRRRETGKRGKAGLYLVSALCSFPFFSAISLAQQLRSKQSIDTSHCITPGTQLTHLFLSARALFFGICSNVCYKKRASLKEKVFEKVPVCKRTRWELMGAFRGLDCTSDN